MYALHCIRPSSGERKFVLQPGLIWLQRHSTTHRSRTSRSPSGALAAAPVPRREARTNQTGTAPAAGPLGHRRRRPFQPGAAVRSFKEKHAACRNEWPLSPTRPLGGHLAIWTSRRPLAHPSRPAAAVRSRSASLPPFRGPLAPPKGCDRTGTTSLHAHVTVACSAAFSSTCLK